ncbi:MAG: DUF1934 domain-containing protein [Clostridia bacterium]|nr:DUF1934 domain-containing protein [Clostridia bacterium]
MNETNKTPAVVRIFADGERYAVRATLRERYGFCELSYADPGMDGTPTRLRFDAKSLTLSRDGAYQTEMRFASGESTSTVYQTPYGALNLTVATERLTVAETGSGWQIDLAYTVGFADGGKEAHEMSILITV